MTASEASQIVLETIYRAERRHTRVLLLEQAPFAISASLGALLLLLIAGSALIHPLWTAAVVCVAAGLVLFQVRRRKFSRYVVAQAIDHRLHLHDTVSTACYLISQDGEPSALSEYQVRSAALISDQVAPRTVFPYHHARRWLVPSGLLLAIFVCLLVRYAQVGRLDLHPALHIGAFLERSGAAEELSRKRDRAGQPPRVERVGLPQSQDPMRQSDGVHSSHAESEGANALRGLQEELKSDRQAAKTTNLLEQMKDAARGLSAELQKKLTPGTGLQQEQHQTASSQGQRNETTAPTSAKPSTGQRSSPSQASSESAEHQAGERTAAQATEKRGGTPLGPADQAAQQKGSDSQSGAGSDEGEKTIRDAAQLQALGKLEQIIGKRSASISGEMRLSRSSRDQQLQTQFTGRVGDHVNSGGETHRDQVPPKYRDYVKAYIDAQHRQSSAHP